MAFESLAHRHELALAEFPPEWLPLCFLYDPDLPLFPLIYFHELTPDLPAGQRPGPKDRVFGFVHHINLTDGGATVGLVLNKDLSLAANFKYVAVVEQVVRERLGLSNPIRLPDVQNALTGPLQPANKVLVELWHQIVGPAFGGILPFGKVWDPVFGLARFIASWYSDGRKGELIQTHFFSSSFGVRIPAGNPVNVDFYLLPTFSELQDQTNPLNLFPAFANLITAGNKFVADYCEERQVGPNRFSAFRMVQAGLSGNLDTTKIIAMINRESGKRRLALMDCFSAYNRGPIRTVLALLMLSDLRMKRWDPSALTPGACAGMYAQLGGSYQSPKVLQLYAQQCFAAQAALPLDIWVKTFLHWPIGMKLVETAAGYANLFAASATWGKVERLIWVSVQARKVHSSVAAEILSCVRFGSSERDLRGANPLACKICDPVIRNACPAYSAISAEAVYFNPAGPVAGFAVTTSAGDGTTANQTFVSAAATGTRDEHSARDRAASFLPYPQLGANDGMTVSDFIDKF